jgi:hypothetical protein
MSNRMSAYMSDKMTEDMLDIMPQDMSSKMSSGGDHSKELCFTQNYFW